MCSARLCHFDSHASSFKMNSGSPTSARALQQGSRSDPYLLFSHRITQGAAPGDDIRSHAQEAVSESQSHSSTLGYSSHSLSQETERQNLQSRPPGRVQGLSVWNPPHCSKQWLPEILSCILSLLFVIGEIICARCHTNVDCFIANDGWKSLSPLSRYMTA